MPPLSSLWAFLEIDRNSSSSPSDQMAVFWGQIAARNRPALSSSSWKDSCSGKWPWLLPYSWGIQWVIWLGLTVRSGRFVWYLHFDSFNHCIGLRMPSSETNEDWFCYRIGFVCVSLRYFDLIGSESSSQVSATSWVGVPRPCSFWEPPCWSVASFFHRWISSWYQWTWSSPSPLTAWWTLCCQTSLSYSLTWVSSFSLILGFLTVKAPPFHL